MPSGRGRLLRTVLVIENNSVPFDRRVWREACALRDANWRVTVVCPQLRGPDGAPQQAREQLDGVEVCRFPLREAAGGAWAFLREYLGALVSIARLLAQLDNEGGFDVLHIGNPPDIFFPLLRHWRAKGSCIVFDHHDLFPESCAHRFRGPVGRAVVLAAHWCERRSMRAADVVIATNESYAELARTRGGVSPDRVFVVRNGPDTRRFRPVPPDPSLRRGRRFLAVYLGIMGPQDGMVELMSAIRHYARGLCREDAHFLLIGDGSERSRMEHLAAAWGVSHLIEFAGLVTDDTRIVTALSTADVCLAPEPSTPFTERSTIVKVAEYMACGRPVLAFDLRETRVTAAEAAWYVSSARPEDYAAALAVILDDEERRQLMGRVGLARVEEGLAWDRQVPNLLAAYARAVR